MNNNGNNYYRRKTDNNIYDYNLNDDNYDMAANDEFPVMNMKSDNQGVNEKTIINLNSGAPVGLDLNKFMMGSDPDQTVHAISQSNDLPIISEVNEQHQSFKGIVTKRLNSLKMISGWWASSDFSSAFNAINLMKDPSVTNDFFYYAFVKNDISKVPLTLDNVITILPHVTTLINSKYEVYVKNGVRTAWNILKCFNDRIIAAKSVVVTNGVDLAREERLKKCDGVIELYEKILNAQTLAKILNKKSNDDLYKYTTQFLTELDFFLKSCKKTYN